MINEKLNSYLQWLFIFFALILFIIFVFYKIESAKNNSKIQKLLKEIDKANKILDSLK